MFHRERAYEAAAGTVKRAELHQEGCTVTQTQGAHSLDDVLAGVRWRDATSSRSRRVSGSS